MDAVVGEEFTHLIPPEVANGSSDLIMIGVEAKVCRLSDATTCCGFPEVLWVQLIKYR